MTDDILAHQSAHDLSESTALAVDCAKFMQLMLVATDMGQRLAELSHAQVAETTGIFRSRQSQVVIALSNAGLIHRADDGWRLGMGDGQ